MLFETCGRWGPLLYPAYTNFCALLEEVGTKDDKGQSCEAGWGRDTVEPVVSLMHILSQQSALVAVCVFACIPVVI